MIQKIEEARRAFAIHRESPPGPTSTDIARLRVLHDGCTDPCS